MTELVDVVESTEDSLARINCVQFIYDLLFFSISNKKIRDKINQIYESYSQHDSVTCCI